MSSRRRLREVPLLLSPSSETRKKTTRQETGRATSWARASRLQDLARPFFTRGFLSRLARRTKRNRDYSQSSCVVMSKGFLLENSWKGKVIITRILKQHFTYCWRALARQLPILYNSEKMAKSVGCKIEDMRSRLCFLYPGIPGCLWMHVEISIDFEQKSSSARNQGHDKRDEIWMLLITCGSIHKGHEWFSDDSRGWQEIFFICFWFASGAVLLCEQFCRFANEGAKISIKSYFMS